MSHRAFLTRYCTYAALLASGHALPVAEPPMPPGPARHEPVIPCPLPPTKEPCTQGAERDRITAPACSYQPKHPD